MVKVLLRSHPVNFGDDELDVEVVPFAALEEERVAGFEAVLEVDAEEDLAEARGNLHIFLGEPEPELSSSPVHPGVAVAGSVDEEGVEVAYVVEVEKLGGAGALGDAGHLAAGAVGRALEDLVDEGGLAAVGPAHEQQLLLLVEQALVLFDLPRQEGRQRGVVDLVQVGPVDRESRGLLALNIARGA